MKVIKNNYNKEITVKCPNCESIFSYDDKEDVYQDASCEDVLRCPCCKEQNKVMFFEELEWEIIK